MLWPKTLIWGDLKRHPLEIARSLKYGISFDAVHRWLRSNTVEFPGLSSWTARKFKAGSKDSYSTSQRRISSFPRCWIECRMDNASSREMISSSPNQLSGSGIASTSGPTLGRSMSFSSQPPSSTAIATSSTQAGSSIYPKEGHRNIRTKAKRRYECPHCDQLFASSWSVPKHVKVSESKRENWSSSLCIKNVNAFYIFGQELPRNHLFSSANNRSVSWPCTPTNCQRAHDRNGHIYCSSCSMHFPNQEELILHRRSVHGTCPYCRKEFIHMERHVIACIKRHFGIHNVSYTKVSSDIDPH